jgi:hypothetical protein
VVNWGNVTLLFCVVESPDGDDRFMSVTIPSMIPNPNANDVGLMFFDIVCETFWWFVREIKW